MLALQTQWHKQLTNAPSLTRRYFIPHGILYLENLNWIYYIGPFIN